MHVLVTRPGTDAERTAEALRRQGHAVTLTPLLTIEPVMDADLGAGPYAAVVMTSANAARVIARHRGRDEILGLPVYTVGRHTAQAAAEAGFAEIESADGGWPGMPAFFHSSLQPCSTWRRRSVRATSPERWRRTGSRSRRW